MKGLAIVLGGKPKNDSKPAPEADEAEPQDSAMEFARLASEATAAGDHDAAAKALVNMVKACKASPYGPSEEEEE